MFIDRDEICQRGSLCLNSFCKYHKLNIQPTSNTMKKISFFLLFIGVIFTLQSCKKDTPIEVSDPYGMFQYTIKSNGWVTFTNTSTDATSFLWDFGDSTTSTSAVTTFDHQYQNAGVYKAVLNAYGNGKVASAWAQITIASETASVIFYTYHKFWTSNSIYVNIGTDTMMMLGYQSPGSLPPDCGSFGFPNFHKPSGTYTYEARFTYNDYVNNWYFYSTGTVTFKPGCTQVNLNNWDSSLVKTSKFRRN